ncbi:MAG: radical SAM protein [Nitrospiraceae bacterium]|nr:MAG: radical SAM protein [Nitrospiraceae bacterium]
MNISLIKVREPSVSIPEVTPPLGLMYLAGYLRKYRPGKDNINIFDLSVQNEEDVLASLKDEDIVGLSSTNRDGLYLQKIVEKVRKTNRSCKLILGGPIVSSLINELFDRFDIDCGVTHEGERTFLEVIEKFDGGDRPFEAIEGVAYKNGGSKFTGRRESIENLDDEIPFPAWDLVLDKPFSNEYWKRKSFAFFRMEKRYMGLFTSRGCPYTCIYCHDMFAKRFRAHSAERVVSELEYLNTHFGLRDFEFYDDTFNFDRDRTRRICDLIVEKQLKINMYFPNGLRADRLEKDIVEKMAKAGTKVMCFAIETVSERLQKLLRRNLKFDNINDMIEVAVQNGIHAEGFFMLGHPTETKEEMMNTIDFAAKSRLHSAAFSISIPQKGTELFSTYIGENAPQKLGEGYYEYSSAISQLPPDQVRKLLAYTFIKFYLRPKRIFRIIRTFPLSFIFSRRFLVQITKWLDVVFHRRALFKQ